MIDEKKLIEEIDKEIDGVIVRDVYSRGKNAGLRKAKILIDEQPKIGEWILCSERLPENPTPDKFYGLSEIDTYPEYIVMIKGAEEPAFLKYMGDGEWYRDGNYYQVAAWMPLPEPYKEPVPRYKSNFMERFEKVN